MGSVNCIHTRNKNSVDIEKHRGASQQQRAPRPVPVANASAKGNKGIGKAPGNRKQPRAVPGFAPSRQSAVQRPPALTKKKPTVVEPPPVAANIRIPNALPSPVVPKIKSSKANASPVVQQDKGSKAEFASATMNAELPVRRPHLGPVGSRQAMHEVIVISDDDYDEEAAPLASKAVTGRQQMQGQDHAAPLAVQIRAPDADLDPAANNVRNGERVNFDLASSVDEDDMFGEGDFRFDKIYDLDSQDELEEIEGFFPPPLPYPRNHSPPMEAGPSNSQQLPSAEDLMDAKEACLEEVSIVFPGICLDYVSDLYGTISKRSDALVAHILDLMEKGNTYPKAQDTLKTLKRKRELDEDEEAAKKWGAANRVVPAGVGGVRPYMVIEEAHRTFDPSHPSYNRLKHPRKPVMMWDDAYVETTIRTTTDDRQKVEVLQELQAARKIRRKAEQRSEAQKLLEIEEAENVRRAEEEGTMLECGCCFADYPLNRMVHCNSDTTHWFCRACARQNAETEIGNSKYMLQCMSMDECMGGFSISQRNQFLEKNTMIALERNEQEAMLRMAGIENLASCPFCPYAAEYPPVEVDKEFRCRAPECQIVSCRLCNLESHVPKSCEELAKEKGLCIRREIEEAMSAALIRKCNNCHTPFVKEEGCNKMTCTRPGCHNIQCYVCSKSCTYEHFNDVRRGGKAGNCPLFENVEQRHDEEVKVAERLAMAKVRAEHPEYTEDDLKIKISENVLLDDVRRAAHDRARLAAIEAGAGQHARPPAAPRNLPAMAQNFFENIRRFRPEMEAPADGDVFPPLARFPEFQFLDFGNHAPAAQPNPAQVPRHIVDQNQAGAFPPLGIMLDDAVERYDPFDPLDEFGPMDNDRAMPGRAWRVLEQARMALHHRRPALPAAPAVPPAPVVPARPQNPAGLPNFAPAPAPAERLREMEQRIRDLHQAVNDPGGQQRLQQMMGRDAVARRGRPYPVLPGEEGAGMVGHAGAHVFPPRAPIVVPGVQVDQRHNPTPLDARAVEDRLIGLQQMQARRTIIEREQAVMRQAQQRRRDGLRFEN